jgi:hypothetical protein
MVILENPPREAQDACARLRHSWLEHMILERNPERVAQMHGLTSSRREAFEKLIEPNGEFHQYLAEARRLVQIMVDGFSPAELVDKSALGCLPTDVLVLIKGILHQVYLTQSNIAHAAHHVKNAVEDLSNELQLFAGVWFDSPPSDYNTIKERFKGVQNRAQVLHAVLGRLPKGTILP